jgi:hypothetical protein
MMKKIHFFLLFMFGCLSTVSAQMPVVTEIPYIGGYSGSYNTWGVMQNNKVYPNSQHKLFMIGQLGFLVVPNPAITAQNISTTWQNNSTFRVNVNSIFQTGLTNAIVGSSVVLLRCPKAHPCPVQSDCLLQNTAGVGISCVGACCKNPGPIVHDYIGEGTFPWGSGN